MRTFRMDTLDKKIKLSELAKVLYSAEKKNNNRKKDKGRRCCLSDRIYSVPCRASCFAQI